MPEWEEKLNSLLSDPDSMTRILHLAQDLSGGAGDGGRTPAGKASAGPPDAEAPQPPPKGDGAPPGDLLGGLDPKLIARYLPLLQKFGTTNTDTRKLLIALKPFLKEDKQAKVERAANLAKLFVITKEFLANWEG